MTSTRASISSQNDRARPAAFPNRNLALLGGGILVFFYVWRYFSDPALPGNDVAFPLGWWGWFDQGHYIGSARGLGRLDLSPDLHWYPLGYALLGAPFTRWSAGHPFVLVDLACLLACYAAFLAFCRRIAVGTGWAAAIFVGSVLCNRLIFAEWVIPWNTSPASAVIWLLLANVAAHMQGARRPFLIGLLAAALPLIRPTEASLAGLSVVAAVLSDLRPLAGRPLRDLAILALGGLLMVCPYLVLHWSIYGVRPTQYMIQSRQLGFTFYDLGWKAYTIFVDPRAWWLDGWGLMRSAPFMALAVGGVVVAAAHGRAAILLAVLLVAHSVLYLSYVDLLPTGFWRYLNVHYWKWAMPGLGLLAFLLVRDVLRWRTAPAFPLAPLALALSMLPLCLRIVPVQAAADEPAKMLAYAGTEPGFEAAYFEPTVLRDSLGSLRNIEDFRVIPVPGGIRVLALRRPFGANPQWERSPTGWHDTAPPVRYKERVRFGRPCWLRTVHCENVSDDLLPPIPPR